MLHHISFGVRDLKLSSAFYDAALGALGFRRVFEDETAVGHGLEDGKDLFCLKLRTDATVVTVLLLQPSKWRCYRRAEDLISCRLDRLRGYP